MNELKIFEHPKFGNIRTITENGKTLFCAKDVAAALGYKDTTNAVKQHCRGVVKRHLIDKLGREQETNFIPEGDIYRFSWVHTRISPLSHSKKPGCYCFCSPNILCNTARSQRSTPVARAASFAPSVK